MMAGAKGETRVQFHDDLVGLLRRGPLAARADPQALAETGWGEVVPPGVLPGLVLDALEAGRGGQVPSQGGDQGLDVLAASLVRCEEGGDQDLAPEWGGAGRWLQLGFVAGVAQGYGQGTDVLQGRLDEGGALPIGGEGDL